jgi:hypothetical protein
MLEQQETSRNWHWTLRLISLKGGTKHHSFWSEGLSVFVHDMPVTRNPSGSLKTQAVPSYPGHCGGELRLASVSRQQERKSDLASTLCCTGRLSHRKVQSKVLEVTDSSFKNYYSILHGRSSTNASPSRPPFPVPPLHSRLTGEQGGGDRKQQPALTNGVGLSLSCKVRQDCALAPHPIPSQGALVGDVGRLNIAAPQTCRAVVPQNASRPILSTDAVPSGPAL